jgi:hypothetical protein
MVLSRRKRAEVATEVKSAMGEFAAAVEARLHSELTRSNQAQLAMVDALRSLHEEMAQRDATFARAFEHLGHAIDQFTAAIEEERIERRALVDAVGALATGVRELPQQPELDRRDPLRSRCHEPPAQ